MSRASSGSRRAETGRGATGRGEAGRGEPGRKDRAGATKRRDSDYVPEKKTPRAAGPTQRQLRVAEEIRHVLAGIFLRREFRDPELTDADITVSEVRLSPDLKHATAFISRLGRSDVQLLFPALKRAIPWMRGQVARALPLRFTPSLSFQPDHALEYAMKINARMNQPDVARDLTPDE